MTNIVDVRSVTKTYASGFKALNGVELQIAEGEILALLGPNGAGKTTLISSICGITEPTEGDIFVGGHHIKKAYRQARGMIGLVPQELTLEPFEKVRNTVALSRGLFGLRQNDAYIEKILRQLSLWDKRDARVMELSGGMKRRVLIAKALSHEPRVLFLDEPTAGVDVELRRDMWRVVEQLRADGVTIILTTHYIEEAEAIADRIAVVSKGQIMLVEETATLMSRLGQKTLTLELSEPVSTLPKSVAAFGVALADDGRALTYTYEAGADRTGITRLLQAIQEAGLTMVDLSTAQSSLEDIFVDLVGKTDSDPAASAAQGATQ